MSLLAHHRYSIDFNFQTTSDGQTKFDNGSGRELTKLNILDSSLLTFCFVVWSKKRRKKARIIINATEPRTLSKHRRSTWTLPDPALYPRPSHVHDHTALAPRMRSPSSASSFLLAHGGRLLWLLPFQFTIVHRVHLKTSHGEVIEKRNWFTIYFYYLFRPQLNCYPADSCRSFCWSIGHGWWWWILPCLASPCSRVSSSVLCRLPFGCCLASINIYLPPYSPVHHYYLYLHFIFIASASKGTASHTTCLPSEIGMGILASTVSPKMSRNFTFYHMQPPAFSISTIIDRSLLLSGLPDSLERESEFH